MPCVNAHTRDCRGLFGNYSKIKALHHARHNLGVTAHLVEFYYTIPTKARALMDLLREQPAQLKYVSEETTKLENWRANFLEALKGYGEKAMTRATFSRNRGTVHRLLTNRCAVTAVSDSIVLSAIVWRCVCHRWC